MRMNAYNTPFYPTFRADVFVIKGIQGYAEIA